MDDVCRRAGCSQYDVASDSRVRSGHWPRRFGTTRRALNCALNSKILEQTPFQDVFVQPGFFEIIAGKSSVEVSTDTLTVR
jgi:hypothetical protein